LRFQQTIRHCLGFLSSPPNFELDDIIAYVDRRFQEAAVWRTPYSHLIIHDILPASFYQALMDAVPPRSKFSRSCPHLEEKDENTYILFASDFERLSEHHQRLFELLRPVVERIANKVYEKLKPHIRESWELFLGQEAEERFQRVVPKNSVSLSILDRTANYNQLAHLDGAYRLGAVLLYMAEDDTSRDLGTDLYRVESSGDPRIHRRNFFSRKMHDLKLVLDRTTPFAPNTIFGVLNSPVSFHGLQSLQRHSQPVLPRRMPLNTWLEMTEDSFQKVFEGFTAEELAAYGK